MGSSTGVRHERQEVSSTDSPRVEGSSPVRSSFLGEFICFNTILGDLPEWSTLGKPRLSALALAPHTGHLVKLSLPDIFPIWRYSLQEWTDHISNKDPQGSQCTLQVSIINVGIRNNNYICLTSLTHAKCGVRSTLCWKILNISGSIELFAL